MSKVNLREAGTYCGGLPYSLFRYNTATWWTDRQTDGHEWCCFDLYIMLCQFLYFRERLKRNSTHIRNRRSCLYLFGVYILIHVILRFHKQQSMFQIISVCGKVFGWRWWWWRYINVRSKSLGNDLKTKSEKEMKTETQEPLSEWVSE